MILEVGKLGISNIRKTNSNRVISKIIINKNLNIGVFTLNRSSIEFDEYYMFCDTDSDAENLFEIINNHYDGTRQEKLERILKDNE